jgi:hypothetical protein
MENKKKEQLKRLYTLSFDIRGKFLDQTIWIEVLISDILSRFFSHEEPRQILFFSLVAPKLEFRAKINILSTLLELHYPELLEGYPKLIDDINNIRKFRNKIAHAHLDTTDEFLKKEYTDRIRLIFFKKGKTVTMNLTKEDMGKRLSDCSKVVLALVDLQKKI